MKFTRATRMTRNQDDGTGLIRIQVMLMHNGQRSKIGNVTRTIRVRDAKVTEVAEAIEKALFE